MFTGTGLTVIVKQLLHGNSMRGSNKHMEQQRREQAHHSQSAIAKVTAKDLGNIVKVL
jgi:hypothetical protein